MKPLRLDVTISQVPVAGGNHPVLLPSDWVRTIDRFGLWDCLFGTSDYGAGQLMLEDFWRKFGTVYGDFEGLKENIPARQLLPIFIHGDEGTHYKRGAVMVLQWQSALGHGTTRLLEARHNDVFGNEAGYHVNQEGVTLRTRLLFSVMPKESNRPRNHVLHLSLSWLKNPERTAPEPIRSNL